MAKEDFKKVLFSNVELQYPRLAETFKYNTAKQQSEPCPPTANGASWSVVMKMSREAARPIFESLKAHYEARLAAGSVKAPWTTVFGMKQLDDGSVEFRAKRNGTKASGDVNTPPKVIDRMKQDLADKNIWGGSKGTVRCWAAPVTDPHGNGGISLFFDAVQVTEAVYGGGGLDDFDEVPDAASNDPFAASAPAAPVSQQTIVQNDLDDEIPF